jgi:hypothetical protein
MTLSAKWTVVSFFALTALAAGSFAFAGCTVTSGKVDDFDGGAGNGASNSDSGSTPDTSTADAAVANRCPGNTKQTVVLIDSACQQAAEAACCAELTACFNIVPDQDAAAGGTDDCNKYATCIASCRFRTDGTPETDQQQIAACEHDCDVASQTAVQDAYTAMTTCITNDPTANAACQK